MEETGTQGTDGHHGVDLEPVDLNNVRTALSTLTHVKVAADVASAIGFSTRRAVYCLNAAWTLGWVQREDVQLALPIQGSQAGRSASTRYTLSDTGQRFLDTRPDSREEKVELGKALMASEALRRLGGSFMTEDIEFSELSRRVQSATGLAEGVARRRARMLLAWKHLALTEEASAPPETPRVQPSGSLDISVQLNAYIASQLSQARLELLIGPGLSRRMRTRNGVPPPSKSDLAAAVWTLCFPRAPFDARSDVDELLQVAAQRNPKAVATLLKESFALEPTALDPSVALLFSLPFQRIYTLAVDDLEIVVDAHHALPRKIYSITGDVPQIASADKLPVIHLHGSAHDGSSRFSPVHDKSATPALAKLAERFDAEYLAYPFLALATDEDIDDVWKVLERRGTRNTTRGSRELRPRTILVCPNLSPVRVALAKDNNVEVVNADPVEFIEKYLRVLNIEIAAGHEVLRAFASSSIDDASNVEEVSEALLREKPHRTEYLMGQEPTWDDVRSGRAITRESDAKVLKAAVEILNSRKLSADRTPASIVALVGTAGTGKSTALMRLAMELSAKGYKAGWIGASTELSSKSIRAFNRGSSRFTVVLVDEADRYGGRTADNLALLAESPGVELVAVSMHSAKTHLLQDPAIAASKPSTLTMPPLADSDIDHLLAALNADHRLGVLKGKNRAYQEAVFKEQAGRSLLVGLIQATSGRLFEEKVVEEWQGLPARARYYYTLITIASSLAYSLTRDELLRSGESTRTQEDLPGIEMLSSGGILAKAGRDVFRSRHKLIAETLMKDLVKLENNDLERAFRDLAFAVTHLLGPNTRENKRGRFVMRLLRYKELHRVLGLDGARSVFEVVEDNMHWDYHYWLQRGSLEVAEGDVKHAEQYLTYAMGMNSNDNLVITEFAYMRMKLAVSNPRTAEASTILSDGVQALRGQIATRGHHDYYPYHVLGSQALAWVRQCGWDRDEKLNFLRGVLRDLTEGARRHPRNLEGLARDVQQRMIAISSGLAV